MRAGLDDGFEWVGCYGLLCVLVVLCGEFGRWFCGLWVIGCYFD